MYEANSDDMKSPEMDKLECKLNLVFSRKKIE